MQFEQIKSQTKKSMENKLFFGKTMEGLGSSHATPIMITRIFKLRFIIYPSNYIRYIIELIIYSIKST